MKASCSDRRDLIDGIIIGVPNKDLDEVDNGSTYHIDDDSTCISALSWGDRSKEPKDQQRSSQETTRRLQPFPWSTPDDSSDVPHDSHEVEQNDLGIKSSAAASNDTYRPLRRSTLVANESGLDASWFAARRLMSNASLDKFFKEEMSKNASQQPAAVPKKKPRNRRSRRASMSELHNERFVVEFTPSLSGGTSSSCMKSNTLSLAPTKLTRKKSLSLDDGLDKLVQSFISSFHDGDEQRTKRSALLIQSKLGKNDGQSIEIEGSSGSGQPKTLASGLSSEELQVLTNMMRRLSHSDSDRYSEQQELCDDEILNPSENRILSTDTLPRSNDLPEPGTTLKSDASTAQMLYKAHLGKIDPVSFSSEAFETKMERTESPYFRDPYMPVLSGEQSDSMHIPPLRRLQSNNTAAAIVCETDDFLKTMKEFDDEVEQQKVSNSDLSGSSMSPTECTSSQSPTSFSSKTVLSPKISSTAPTTMTELDRPPLKQDCGDLLAEGIEHLSMAMLVNIYGKLREMSMLGHVSVKLRDIDVNSHQYNSRKKELKRLGEWTEADEVKGYLDTTRKAGFIVRCVIDETELLEAEHTRGVENEFKHALLAYDASLLKDFKTWVEESRVKQLDTATECVIKKIREECSQRQTVREEMMSSKHSLPASGKSDNSLRLARRRGSLMNVCESFQGASWMKQERKLIEDHFGVKNDLPLSRRKSFCRDRLPGELSGSIIKKAIEESTDAFFEEGSVMRNLLESGFEVVWFADRHPSDIIYGICVNRETSTVTVVFRGQESVFDLCRNTAMSSFPNPIAHEDYDGNSEHINLRSIVADELLRVRMDTKMSLISEIRKRVVIIGQELTNGAGYHLSVVGHARGGGYATVLGYFLASDMYLELASSVRVFTFASSPVGCADFQKGFTHLEQEGRLVHARFANSNDLFTSLPLRGYCEENDTKVKYHHVGMQVRLHKVNEAGRRRIKKSLDVCYDVNEPLLIEMARAGRNLLSSILSLICFSYTKNYCISQYHLRMHFAREYRLALGDGVLRFDRKRKCLKSLNEYYVMKCHHVHNNFRLEENRTIIPTWAVFMLVASVLYVQIDIFLKIAGL